MCVPVNAHDLQPEREAMLNKPAFLQLYQALFRDIKSTDCVKYDEKWDLFIVYFCLRLLTSLCHTSIYWCVPIISAPLHVSSPVWERE